MSKEIKVGGTLYAYKTVRFGFNGRKSFAIPVRVERLTKTQIICSEGKRYSRAIYVHSKYGAGYGGIGHGGALFIEGKDQTKEMEAFQDKIRTIDYINDLYREPLEYTADYHAFDLAQLAKILEHIREQTLAAKGK